MSSISSSFSRAALAGARSTASARCGRPIGLPAAMRAVISRFVELEAELAQGGGHAQRALLAVGEELGEPLASAAGRCGRCRSRGCAVRARRGRRRRRRRSRRRGRRATPSALAGGDRLGDAADGVVVGEREQLDAGVGGALDDLGRRRGRRRSGSSVIAGRSAGGHRRGSVCDRAQQELAWSLATASSLGAAHEQPTTRRATLRAGDDGGVVAAGLVVQRRGSP